MKIYKLRLLEKTENYFIIEIEFIHNSFFGKNGFETKTCVVTKICEKIHNVKFFDSGDSMNIFQLDSVKAFIETGKNEMIIK